jgi:exosome complex component RRP4
MQDAFTGDFHATVCGSVERINKLVFVRPIKQKYSGDIGDVIVARIAEVSGDRWIIDYGGTQTAVLTLGGVNLPGSVQRRRTDEDKMQMRDLFKEGDVFACEIQKIMEAGDVVVHCRSNKYGILRNGQLVQVDGSLVKRQTSHFINISHPNGEQIQLVLGNNGWIWIGLPSKQTGHIQSLNFTQMDSKDEIVQPKTREVISKIRNCVLALSDAFMEITVDSITTFLTELEKSGDIYVSERVSMASREYLLGNDSIRSEMIIDSN